VFALVADTLLFLHVLSGFLLMATVVMLSGVALGAVAPGRTVSVANIAWDVGGVGTLVFGIWLALRDDVGTYELLDFWVVAAIVLWLIATELGRRARKTVGEGRERFARWHWLRAAVVVLLLADMIFKPGA
jgi:hypothetical protein